MTQASAPQQGNKQPADNAAIRPSQLGSAHAILGYAFCTTPYIQNRLNQQSDGLPEMLRNDRIS